MNGSFVLRCALGALAVSTALTACRGNKSAEPPVHPNLNMDFVQYYKPQEDNAWFPDKRAVRPLPAGTVAQGHAKTDRELHVGRGDNGRFLDGLPSTMTLDADLLARGEARYDIYCTPCHAKAGDGQGIVVARGLKVPPPSYFEPRLQAMPLGYLYDVIKNGKGTMKGYASQVPVEDRWAIAAWVRTLQVGHRATLADLPPAERARIEGATP